MKVYINQSSTAVKVWTPFTVTQALGYGSTAKGGAPSTADGRLFAFGNTLESAIKMVLGLRQQGVDGQPPFDRTSGEGFVAAHDGDYADALRKRYSVVLFNVESTGARSARSPSACLRSWPRTQSAKAPPTAPCTALPAPPPAPSLSTTSPPSQLA